MRLENVISRGNLIRIASYAKQCILSGSLLDRIKTNSNIHTTKS